jgi:hypothetical protein
VAGARVGLNGETLQTIQTSQRRTSARHNHRQVLENRPRGSQGLLNRDSGVLLEVLYQNVQRGGDKGEILCQFDSLIMVASACLVT